MEYTIKISSGLSGFSDAKAVRRAVFMEEQGFQNEFDDIDSRAIHAVLYSGEMPVAVGRAFADDDFYHIGRIAVLKPYRGRQLGKAIMEALEDTITAIGGRQITLSAQVQAQEFYARLGYSPVGEPYMDEHCLHISMKKTIN